jgi:hypothetical protein
MDYQSLFGAIIGSSGGGAVGAWISGGMRKTLQNDRLAFEERQTELRVDAA